MQKRWADRDREREERKREREKTIFVRVSRGRLGWQPTWR